MATDVITGSRSIEQWSEPPTDIVPCLFSLLRFEVSISNPEIQSGFTVATVVYRRSEGERVNEKGHRLGNWGLSFIVLLFPAEVIWI